MGIDEAVDIVVKAVVDTFTGTHEQTQDDYALDA